MTLTGLERLTLFRRRRDVEDQDRDRKLPVSVSRVVEDVPEAAFVFPSNLPFAIRMVSCLFGHAFEEQTARQAIAAGAVDRTLDSLPDFDLGLELVIDGLRSRLSG